MGALLRASGFQNYLGRSKARRDAPHTRRSDKLKFSHWGSFTWGDPHPEEYLEVYEDARLREKARLQFAFPTGMALSYHADSGCDVPGAEEVARYNGFPDATVNRIRQKRMAAEPEADGEVRFYQF